MAYRPLHPLGTDPWGNYKPFLSSIKQYLCDDFPEANQFFNNDFKTRVGCGSFVHVFPFSIFVGICRERRHPAADIIQSSHLLPTIASETVNDRNRQSPGAHFNMLHIRQRHIRSWTHNPLSLGSKPTVSALQAQMQLPLNPQSLIQDDFTKWYVSKVNF